MTENEPQPDPSAPTPVKHHTDALSQNTNPNIQIVESSGEIIGIAGTTPDGGASLPSKPVKVPFDPASLDIEGLEILDPNDGTAIGIMCTRPGAGTTEREELMKKLQMASRPGFQLAESNDVVATSGTRPGASPAPPTDDQESKENDQTP